MNYKPTISTRKIAALCDINHGALMLHCYSLYWEGDLPNAKERGFSFDLNEKDSYRITWAFVLSDKCSLINYWQQRHAEIRLLHEQFNEISELIQNTYQNETEDKIQPRLHQFSIPLSAFSGSVDIQLNFNNLKKGIKK